jgi:large subunit ribosomal protein L13
MGGSDTNAPLAVTSGARSVYLSHYLTPAHSPCSHLLSYAAAADIQNLGPDRWNFTYYPNGSDAANVTKPWFIIDAEGQTLGRLANLAAVYIRGKNSAAYTPSVDMGAYVVIINADKVAVSGKKETDKIYYRQGVTGRPGSMKKEALRDLRKRLPERIIERAVKGMLPKGRLGSVLFTHLKVFKGTEHPHEAQQPVDITARISVGPADAVKL